MKEQNMKELRPYEEEAHIVAEAIRTLAKDEAALDNFEYYLSLHFAKWLVIFANTPESITAELNSFAHINDQEEANA